MTQDEGRTTRDGPAGTGTAGHATASQATRPGSQKRTAQEPGTGVRRTRGETSSELVTSGGRTQIADAVVAKIAGMAAREIGGVHAMGAGMSRTLGSVKERVPGMSAGANQGVAVQVGERQAAVDIDLIVDYGVSIPDLAGAVRENVVNEVEHMCGLEVVEVDITVDDIHVPEDDGAQPSDQPREPRVR